VTGRKKGRSYVQRVVPMQASAGVLQTAGGLRFNRPP